MNNKYENKIKRHFSYEFIHYIADLTSLLNISDFLIQKENIINADFII